MPFSDFLNQKLLAKAFHGQDFEIAGHWCSVHNGDPGKTGTDEALGAPYERKQVPQFTETDTEGTARRVRSIAALFFQVPAGTYTHVGLWDAPTGGNFLGGGLLSGPVTVNDGDFVIVRENDLAILQD